MAEKNGSGKFASNLVPHEPASKAYARAGVAPNKHRDSTADLVKDHTKRYDGGAMKKVLTGVAVTVLAGLILGATSRMLATWNNDDKQDQKLERIDRDLQKHGHAGQQKMIHDVQKDVAVIKTDMKNQGKQLEEVKEDMNMTRESLNRIERRLGLPGDERLDR